jgi:hypothetical protein
MTTNFTVAGSRSHKEISIPGLACKDSIVPGAAAIIAEYGGRHSDLASR